MARRAVLCALAVIAIVPAAGAEQERLPGPAPQDREAGFDAAAENARCESCHADIAAEWRGSLHHAAWDDPLFLTAYVIEPQAFCRGCHAPEGDPEVMPSEAARRLGVGCVTCHVQGGDVVGVHARSGGDHGVRGDARLATAAACDGCHQFEFPVAQDAPMQGTGEEHAASPHAGESCQSCHMKRVADADGREHTRHDFRVFGDRDLLASAVVARAARSGDRAIAVTLRTGAVGHAVPTGDMFRRLEVRARAGTDAAPPAILARRFRFVDGPEGRERRQIGDERLPASGAPRVVTLAFDAPIAAREVRWQVVYQRMAEDMATLFGVDPAADEIIVAEGILPAEDED
jgi:hypothetical protein